MAHLTSYDEATVEAGLLELASWHGNSRQASRVLKENGITIPANTLQAWKKTHAARYDEIRAKVLPEIRAKLAVEQERVARRAAEVALSLVERTAERITEIPDRDLAGAARNMEVVAATAIDKHSIIHNYPTEIRQIDSAEDLLLRMQRRHPGLFIEGTAEEIPQRRELDRVARSIERSIGED